MPLDLHTYQETMYDRVLTAYKKEGINPAIIKKDWFNFQPKLVICGGGHVAIQLAKIAKMIDFYIQVIDDREEFANQSNFPDVDEICCNSFENMSEILPKEGEVYYVVVTRGHAADRICVEQILRRTYVYLGMIGSRLKVEKTFQILEEEGFDQKLVETIHAPIGLAIKAQTPAEIAVSIMAEIIECKNSKRIGSITRELNQSKDRGTLCIITAKTGSGPRDVGSMMLVKKDGSILGSIGGGIVEHEATIYAISVAKISVVSYDLSNNESAKLGMICGGTYQVTFIPL